jgi:hypothetical protein
MSDATKAAGPGASFGAQSGLDRRIEPASAPLRASAWLCAAILCGAPVAQALFELAQGERVQALDYLKPFEQGPAGRPLHVWARDVALELADEPRLRGFERELREVSLVRRALLPWYQLGLTAALEHGNKKSVVGRADWLFFADDLESAYGRGILEPGAGAREALAAIEDFKAQLDRRGIRLLLLPSYSKEMVEPRMLSRFTGQLEGARNPDLGKFYAMLDRSGVEYLRMDEMLLAARAAAADPNAPLWLARDTHWTPRTMAFCAQRIAERARAMLGEDGGGGAGGGGSVEKSGEDGVPPPVTFSTRRVEIDGQGDLLRMLSLPADQKLYPPMHLELEQVVDGATGELARSDSASDVLLMGDSLTKVFGDPALGLGEGAGLAEHLMLRLGRRLDVIALAGGSATATREALARRDDGLKGKQLVIWQFGVRMLAAGPQEWRPVKIHEPADNPYGQPPVPSPGVSREKFTIVGEIVEASTIPRHFDYDFCLAVYEYRVLGVVDGTFAGDRVWVAHPAIVNGRDTPARTFPVGARHRLTLDDLRLHYDTEQVTWIDATDVGRNVMHFPLRWHPAH